jgi:hypothetical protein
MEIEPIATGASSTGVPGTAGDGVSSVERDGVKPAAAERARSYRTE